jgi:5-methylcytosine-specific restriction enzyme subunit McrC
MSVKRNYTIREHSYLLDGENHAELPNAVGIPKPAFKYLLSYIQDSESDVDFAPFLKLTTFQRQTALKIQNYVGVLRAPCGTQIEVLPKLYRKDDESSADGARQLLIKMLSCLRESPFKQAGSAEIRDTKMPLLEVYISQFLALTNQLIKRGIRSDYVRERKNATFLKGRLLVSEQIRRNSLHPERFAIECDEYLVNRPANRLIKSTLAKVASVTQNPRNQRLARELGFVFDEVPASTDIRGDFQRIVSSRGMSYYGDVLAWCRLLLNGNGPTASVGNVATLSLLYPMERIFEDYVAHCLRANLYDYFKTGCTLKTQAAKHSLVDEHEGKGIFSLRPDLLVLQGREVQCVMDTKWKLLDASDRKNKYGISQADMYQLYAYGHKYLKGAAEKSLMLIYPKTEFFQEPLPDFTYEDGFVLKVVPFDLDRGELVWSFKQQP